jgi:hypothetical protein
MPATPLLDFQALGPLGRAPHALDREWYLPLEDFRIRLEDVDETPLAGAVPWLRPGEIASFRL